MSEPMSPEGAVDTDAVDQMAAILDNGPLDQEEETKTEQVEEPAEPEEAEAKEEETEVEEDEGQPEEAEEEPQVYTLADLAEAWDMTPEQVGEMIQVQVKASGETSTVTLKELQTGYSRQSDYTTKTQELAAARQKFEKETEDRFNQIEQMHHVMAQALQYDLQQLEQERQSINWQEMKAIDPADYAAKAMDFQQREQQLNQRIQTGMQQWEAMQTQRKELQDAQLREQTRKGLEIMAQDVPEWANDETRAIEQEGIASLLLSAGYTPEEMNLLVDPRAIKVARKAMLYDKLQAETPKPAPRKKVKILKPGAKRTNLSSDDSKYMNAMKRAKRLGTDDAYAEALAVKLKL